jgi:hypothetical protein
MRQKIYTINDFDFKPHVVIEGAVQGLLKLPNGITVSIVGGGLQSIVGGMNRLRGDGVDTFELASWRANGGLINDWIKLDGDNEILEYVDKNKLPIILLDLSKK